MRKRQPTGGLYSGVIALLVGALSALPSTASAAFPLSSSWQPVSAGGVPVIDPIYDFPGSNAVDIVGDALRPSLYWYIDAEDASFRARLEDDPRAPGSTMRDLYGVLIDTDGDPSQYECVVQLRESGTVLGIYKNTTFTTGGWTDAPNTLATWYLAAPLSTGTPSARVTPVGDGTSGFGSDEDYFVEMRVPRATLDAHCGFATALGYSLGFATTEGGGSPFALRTDLLGIDNNVGGDLSDALSDVFVTDADADGLSLTQEAEFGTDPELSDTDGDGLSDYSEVVVTGTDPADADSDDDGLNDGDELSYGTDPYNADTDGDGAQDGREITGGTSPLIVDSDGDGIGDLDELDCNDTPGADADDRDGDGLPDTAEGREDSDRDDRQNWCDPDDDGDGIPTEVEGTDDLDGDDIPNHLDTDADGDGIADYEEGRADPDCDAVENWADAENEDGPCGDLDGDGADNAREEQCGTDPNDPDSDDDGLPDGEESCVDDADDDGVPDVLDPDNGGGDGGGSDGFGADTDPLFGLAGGKITGGACSALPLPSALVPALLAMVAAASRRRRSQALGAVAALSVTGSAAAQEMNGQTFRPAIGEDDFISIDDSRNGPELLGAGLIYNYAKDPLVWRYENGSERPILEKVHTMNLQTWGNIGPVRLGLDLPLHMGVVGLGVDPGEAKVLGDLRLDARAEVLERGKAPVGLGFGAHVQTASGDGQAWVGEPSWSGGLRSSATYGNDDRFVAGTLGLLFSKKEVLPADGVWGNRFHWGLGATSRLVGPLRGSAELIGTRFLGSSTGAAATPLEAQLSLRARPIDPLLVSVGAGFGLTEGMGAPSHRWIAAVSGTFGSAKPGIDATLTAPGPGRTPTHLRFLAEDGGSVAEASFTIVSGPSSGRVIAPHEGPLVLHLKPGVYNFTVEASGFSAVSGVLEIPATTHHEQRIALARISGSCEVTIFVRDAEQRPIAAKVSSGKGLVSAQTDPNSGVARFTLPPGGAHEFVVSAPGYSPEHRAAACERGEGGQLKNIEKEVVLGGSRARLEGSKVIIMDKINFETNQARLKAEAKGVLDDVAAVMASHPEIKLLEIQGHTDLVGSAAYNLQLGQQRAEQVRSYLINVHGVDPKRLKAKGYGESAPMVAATGREADEANRRVEFHVLEQGQR